MTVISLEGMSSGYYRCKVCLYLGGGVSNPPDYALYQYVKMLDSAFAAQEWAVHCVG